MPSSFVRKPLIVHTCYWDFLSKGKAQKMENVKSSSHFLGTKNPRDVCVIVAAFWRKIRAMPLRYFLQIALNYCKIKVCHTLANVFWMFFSGKQYYRLKHSSRRWKSSPDESHLSRTGTQHNIIQNNTFQSSMVISTGFSFPIRSLFRSFTFTSFSQSVRWPL